MGTCSREEIDCVSGALMPEVLEEDEELDSTERACDTLLMCIVTVMNHGLRNGGGVGDILRKPSKDVSTPAPPRSTRPEPWPRQVMAGRAAWPLSLQC